MLPLVADLWCEQEELEDTGTSSRLLLVMGTQWECRRNVGVLTIAGEAAVCFLAHLQGVTRRVLQPWKCCCLYVFVQSLMAHISSAWNSSRTSCCQWTLRLNSLPWMEIGQESCTWFGHEVIGSCLWWACVCGGMGSKMGIMSGSGMSSEANPPPYTHYLFYWCFLLFWLASPYIDSVGEMVVITWSKNVS